MEVAIGTRNRVYRYTTKDTMSFLRATFLRDTIPGFREGRVALLKVRYHESGRTAYHRYEGGPIWIATASDDVASPGQKFTITAELLTTEEFVRSIPTFNLRNKVGFGWLPDESQVVRILYGKALCMVVQQQPVVGVSKFNLLMEERGTLGFGPGKGCFLEAKLWDFFGQPRGVRVYHDGHSTLWIGLRQGRMYPRVSLLSFDGVRLRLAYGSPRVRVASIYLDNPAQLYHVEKASGFRDLDFERLSWRPFGSYHISLKRDLESRMLQSKYRYPHGRIGSEVAYSIASCEYGLDGLVLCDPSEGGADMMSADGKVLFENRLVTITEAMSRELLERQVVLELGRMKARLASDLAFYSGAEGGFASLSFVGLDG